VNASDDLKKKDLVDAKNLAEQMIYTAEKALKDNANVPDDIKSGVTGKIEALKKEKDSGTLENIKSTTEALSTEMSKIGEWMAKNSQQTTDNPPPTNGNPETKTDENPENPDIKDAETK
jgi:molecular chaperone DnaK